MKDKFTIEYSTEALMNLKKFYNKDWLTPNNCIFLKLYKNAGKFVIILRY